MTDTIKTFIRSLTKKTVRHYKYYVCYHSYKYNSILFEGKRLDDLRIRKAQSKKNAEKPKTTSHVIHLYKVVAEFDTRVDAFRYIEKKIRDYQENEKYAV